MDWSAGGDTRAQCSADDRQTDLAEETTDSDAAFARRRMSEKTEAGASCNC